MDMQTAAGWIAPAATMIAAMITAANLGARVTGWGFVVFAVGSVCWSIVAIGSGQANLLWTNAFLTIVNAVGIWRWLGRQARYADGGKAAAAKSEAAPTADLIPLGSLASRTLIGRGGEQIGVVVDGMMRCEGASVAYWVVSEGGIGGVGERLHGIMPDQVQLRNGDLTCSMSAAELADSAPLAANDWPAALRPSRGADPRLD